MPYLTPDAATGDNVCRRFTIPVELLPIFMGALDVLTFDFMYEQFGDLTPEETASLFREVVASMETEPGECMTEPLGDIRYFTMQLSFHPDFNTRWFLCDGAPFLKADFPEYWQQLVDTGYDYRWEADATHFYVPDASEVFFIGTTDEPGGTGGEREHTLTIAEMPAHTHSEQDPGVVVVQSGAGAAPLSDPGLPSATGSTGGGGAHNNMPPYLYLCPYIRLRR